MEQETSPLASFDLHAFVEVADILDRNVTASAAAFYVINRSFFRIRLPLCLCERQCVVLVFYQNHTLACCFSGKCDMFSTSCYPFFPSFSQRQNRLVKTSLPFTHFKLTSCIFRCADRFPNAPHSVFMIRSFWSGCQLIFQHFILFFVSFSFDFILFCQFFRHPLFLSFSQYLDPQVDAPSASPRCFCSLSLFCYIRHFSHFVDCPKNNSVLYFKACLKTNHRHPLFQVLFGIQQKEWSFLMKVLILSCNTGGGHNAAASALKKKV